MKKDFNTKKKIAIVALSLAAVSMAGAVFYVIDGATSDAPNTVNTETPVVADDVVVPEIQDVIIEPAIIEPVVDVVEESNVTSANDDKPKTKDEAVAPTDDSEPVVDENGEEQLKVVEPSKTDSPQNGDRLPDGSIYTDEFGWIPYSGPNITLVAPNAGTGDIIGSM